MPGLPGKKGHEWPFSQATLSAPFARFAPPCAGNGPLVAILREALARDKIRRGRELGRRLKKGKTLSEVKLFIQNVHHFRDECLIDADQPPIEQVALFDEDPRFYDATFRYLADVGFTIL
jgi:hypothetical protein